MCVQTQRMLTAGQLASLLLILTVLLTGSTCGPKNPIGEEKGGLAKGPSGNPSMISTPATTNANASSGEKIGVPECDEFIAKYEACTSKVPEVARAQYKAAVDQWRSSWKKLAANPATKGTLAAACKQAAEQQAAAWKMYGCAN